ncbi:leucine-rich repeat-containing protein kinase family protein [Litorimonas sp. WD9-15]|uniref:leucine-rich repeat-containing protein kinase family protein n=1 Tax=Litorimonas sp. WD9-15 TaxID=3418716 RepID=UPI003D03F61A
MTHHTLNDLKNGRLAGLREVKISDGLTEVPREIFDLADTLEILDLSGNQIKSLPDDFARLSHLKILFLANNDFTVFPKVLSQCAKLSMIGFKANKISQLPEYALPKQTRWLILTDNKLTHLPDSIGDLPHLQKLMLAGNQLAELPLSIAQCHALELIRISANQLTAFPGALLGLPKLAWLAFSGNPFCVPFPENDALPTVSFDDVSRGEILGAGASGIITRGDWINAPTTIENPQGPLAVKTFKGAVTSDGYPRDEFAASLAAGVQDGLIPILATIISELEMGLVMELIEERFSNLGQPPNLETCTRDVFLKDTVFSPEKVLKMAQSLSRIMVHLRARDICHGDLYAHNILVNEAGDILLGDFGAASHYVSLSHAHAKALESIEVRAFGCFLEDILGTMKLEDCRIDFITTLKKLSESCLRPNANQRPDFARLQEQLCALPVT